MLLTLFMLLFSIIEIASLAILYGYFNQKISPFFEEIFFSSFSFETFRLLKLNIKFFPLILLNFLGLTIFCLAISFLTYWFLKVFKVELSYANLICYATNSLIAPLTLSLSMVIVETMLFLLFDEVSFLAIFATKILAVLTLFLPLL